MIKKTNDCLYPKKYAILRTQLFKFSNYSEVKKKKKEKKKSCQQNRSHDM